jgi:hypothetical protein
LKKVEKKVEKVTEPEVEIKWVDQDEYLLLGENYE